MIIVVVKKKVDFTVNNLKLVAYKFVMLQLLQHTVTVTTTGTRAAENL